MKKGRRIIWLACLLGALHVQADPLRVSAAASLSEALREVNVAFTKESSAKVELNLGASSLLARQIEEGVPADVFFSADLAKLDVLDAKGLLLAGTRAEVLSNTLVIIVPSESQLLIKDEKGLVAAEIHRIATGDPKAVPVGVYAQIHLEKLGLWDAVAPKLLACENVRAALAAVESGNVEAGIVYKTDATISKKVKIAYEIPAQIGPMIIYPVAVLKESSQQDVAKKYLKFLRKTAAKVIFEKFGFVVLPEMAAKP